MVSVGGISCCKQRLSESEIAIRDRDFLTMAGPFRLSW